MKIQVAIVSDQILANLIPALTERPDLIYLVTSRHMAAHGLDRRLIRLLADAGIAVENRCDAPDSGLADIHQFAYALAEAIDRLHPDAAVTLNATGGNKLMMLGFVDAFRDIGARIIYTDTARRRIECLEPGATAAKPASLPLPDLLDVPHYLVAQGFRVSRSVSDDPAWRERAAARKAACKYLGQQAASLGDFIGVLNGLAHQALGETGCLVAPRQRLVRVPWGNWAEALAQLVRARLLDWHDGSMDIEFRDDETTRFLHGGWLEGFAWHALRDNGAFDARLGVNGTWEGGVTSKNEFDVLATQQNRLLFIECKTLRHREENDNDLAYKVDSLGRDARGLFGATWLVTAREPSGVLLERARQARIRVFGPRELPDLRDHVRHWLAGDGN